MWCFMCAFVYYVSRALYFPSTAVSSPSSCDLSFVFWFGVAICIHSSASLTKQCCWYQSMWYAEARKLITYYWFAENWNLARIRFKKLSIKNTIFFIYFSNKLHFVCKVKFIQQYILNNVDFYGQLHNFLRHKSIVYRYMYMCIIPTLFPKN